MKPFSLVVLIFIAGCGKLPTDVELSSFVGEHRRSLDELAAMLQADFDQHHVIEVSLTEVDVLPGERVPELDASRLGTYRSRLSEAGLQRVVMMPFGKPPERHPAFAVAIQGFSGNFTQRGVLKADRCPTAFADQYDEERFTKLPLGWCTFSWHSL